MLPIPTSFECLGTTITVVRRKLPKKHGHFDPNTSEIVLHDNLTDEQAYLTFLHEFMHCALCTLSYDLWEDEDLVERLAQVTYQLFKSARYEDTSESD